MTPALGAVQIGSIQLFCKAAELGSYTAAARAMGVTPAAVSRAVARLEERLGVQLFARSTRRIRLTEQGQLYYAQCRLAIQQIEEVERTLSDGRATPAGTLRISVPTTYGHYRLLPLIERYRHRYPDVMFDVDISNHNVDFADGNDLAVRMGEPADTRLVARRLEDATLGVYASADYLRRKGRPCTLGDLATHDCIAFVRPSTGRAMPWLFRGADGVDVDMPIDGPVRVAGDVLGCLRYGQAGGGLVQTYDFLARHPASGELEEVLSDYRGRSRPFSILYPQNRHLTAKVRAFIDFVCAEIGTPPVRA